MKLLFVTLFLSIATRNIDAAKITDTPMTSNGGDQESDDYSDRQIWWKREKRKNEARKTGSTTDPLEIFFSLFPTAESIESSDLFTLIRYLKMNSRTAGSWQNDLRKSTGKEYLRYGIVNAMPQAAKNFVCGSRKECYRRKQDWEMEKPFYVEEPSWIKIDNDLSRTRSIHRFDVTDPFVISRGKKARGVESPGKRGNVYAFLEDRFADETSRKLKFENGKTYAGNGYEDGGQKVSKNTTEGENTAKYRAENEMGLRSSKFRPSSYADRSIDNAMLDKSDSVLFLERKKRDNFADRDTFFNTVRKKFAYGISNRCLEQPCLSPTDKMDARGLDHALLEKPIFKRIDPHSNSDPYSDLSIGRSVAEDMLERLIENLQCDSTRCTDQSGRTSKRTRLADGRGILEHLLAKSDPFYVARGKRVSENFLDPPVDENTDIIYVNDRNP